MLLLICQICNKTSKPNINYPFLIHNNSTLKNIITMASSFENIIDSETPVLVDFYATWCGPCKTMSPILTDLKKRIGDNVKIIKIDVDKAQALAQELRISGVPTLILYKNSQPVWRQSGVVPLHQLEQVINQFS